MLARDNKVLFNEGDLRNLLAGMDQQIPEKVDAIPKVQFLSTSEDTLVETLFEDSRVEPLQVHDERMDLTHTETKVDVSQDPNRIFGLRHSPGPVLVPGNLVVVSIPFSGAALLWGQQPSAFDFNPPRGKVVRGSSDLDGCVEIVFELPSDSPPERLKSLLDVEVAGIKRYVQNQRAEVEGRNAQLASRIREAVKARRTRIEASDKISSVLGIPLRRREGVPDIRPLPLKRRLVRTLPPAPAGGYRPEPGISDDDYEYILKVIRHEGGTFEATPKTFRVHDEEELRDILLARRSQAVDATARPKTSEGFIHSRLCRGRSFSSRETAARSARLKTLRSVPLGKYWRSKPFVFSLLPRCQGLCGSQKKTFTLVSIAN
jgi:hypothetical protein